MEDPTEDPTEEEKGPTDEVLRALMVTRDDALERLAEANRRVDEWNRVYRNACDAIDRACPHVWVRTWSAMYEREYTCTICGANKIV